MDVKTKVPFQDVVTNTLSGRCGMTFPRYVSQIEDYRSSDNRIDVAELEDLYNIAEDCSPNYTGSDVIQGVFHQFLGIPNPEGPAAVARGEPVFVPGRLVTYFPEGENLCMTFSLVGQAFCEDSGDMPSDLQSEPIRWSLEAEDLREQLLNDIRNPQEYLTGNWRVTDESADLKTALDLITRHPEHKDIVHLGMRKALRSAKAPGEILEISNQIRDILVKNHQLSQKGKRHYGLFLSSVVDTLLQHRLREPMMSDYFRGMDRENNFKFTLATRDREELRNEQVQKYRETTLGMIHDNGTLIMGGWAAIKIAGATWAVVTGKVALAAAATVLGSPVVLIGGALILTGIAIRIYHKSKAEKPYEDQFKKQIVWERPTIKNDTLKNLISDDYQGEETYVRNR